MAVKFYPGRHDSGRAFERGDYRRNFAMTSRRRRSPWARTVSYITRKLMAAWAVPVGYRRNPLS